MQPPGGKFTCKASGYQKAAQQRRTPKRTRGIERRITATFWSAAVLCRFRTGKLLCGPPPLTFVGNPKSKMQKSARESFRGRFEF
jgi:hypothetical protein